MYPWTLHHRLLFAFALPVGILLISLAFTISSHYRNDLLASYQHSRQLTLRSTATVLKQGHLNADDEQAWLQQSLNDNALHRLSLLSSDGRILADVGQSQTPLPSPARAGANTF